MEDNEQWKKSQVDVQIMHGKQNCSTCEYYELKKITGNIADYTT